MQNAKHLTTELDVVGGYITGLIDELSALHGEGSITHARAFVELKALKDKMEAVLKPFDAAYEDMKVNKLPSVLDGDGVPSVNLEEGYRVTVVHNVRASVRGGRRDDAILWLRENGLGDLVSETINASTLSAVARTLAEDNKQLDDDIFSVHVMPTTSVTKTKEKA